jgi:arylsulfatase A-like enzyme
MQSMKQSRRGFLAALGAAPWMYAAAAPRPNILWITTEDIGQQLGSYGDSYAVTPNLDQLAARGFKYRNAWSNAPVCAPARTTIITGMYPTSTGSEHMRSMTNLPAGMKMFPCYLREAGYYASNNAKEDYNLELTGEVWDESSKQAHWRKRKPGQPFFSVFNNLITHESQVIKRPHKFEHDPAKARVPAYHPDTIEVREDWAEYYDNITTMDRQSGDLLKELEKDGLAEDTIVVFFGDHGAGMPRSKRFPYDSGLRVALLVYIPEKFKHLRPKEYRVGETSEHMVAFVDLAPSMLSLAGVKPPAFMQGNAFLGPYGTSTRQFNFGFRGRMDERYDLMRSLCDQRFVYIRNYMPQRIYGQYVGTMFQTPTTRVWKRLYDEGKANAAQKHFWEQKPPEELYDLQNDRDEVSNLAASPAHRDTLERMRAGNLEHLMRIRDVGFLPEGEIHSRSVGSSPYEVGHDDKRYPIKRIIGMAELASFLKPEAVPQLIKGFEDPDSAVRYWAASGILMRGADGLRAARPAMRKALTDSGGYVRAVAAEAFASHGDASEVQKALAVLAALVPADKNGGFVSLWALDTIDRLGTIAKPILPEILQAQVVDPRLPARSRQYGARIMAKFKGEKPKGGED